MENEIMDYEEEVMDPEVETADVESEETGPLLSWQPLSWARRHLPRSRPRRNWKPLTSLTSSRLMMRFRTLPSNYQMVKLV